MTRAEYQTFITFDIILACKISFFYDLHLGYTVYDLTSSAYQKPEDNTENERKEIQNSRGKSMVDYFQEILYNIHINIIT